MQLFTKIVSKMKYTYKDIWDFFYRFGCLGYHAVDVWWHVPRQYPGYIRICYLCQMSYLYEDYKDLYMYIIKKSPLFFYITVIQNWHCQIWIFNPFASMVFVSCIYTCIHRLHFFILNLADNASPCLSPQDSQITEVDHRISSSSVSTSPSPKSSSQSSSPHFQSAFINI